MFHSLKKRNHDFGTGLEWPLAHWVMVTVQRRLVTQQPCSQWHDQVVAIGNVKALTSLHVQKIMEKFALCEALTPWNGKGTEVNGKCPVLLSEKDHDAHSTSRMTLVKHV